MKHILVIRLSSMGDVAMTVPVLSAFSNSYPDIKLTVLTKKQFAPLFRDLDSVSVLLADFKKDHKGFFGLYQLSKLVRNLHIDAVADLHNVLRTKILKFFLSGVKVAQIDKGRSEKKALVSGRISESLRSTPQRYADVFRGLGFGFEIDPPIFLAPEPLDASITKILGDFSKATVGIAPFAAYASKTYPLSQMETVITELQKESKLLLFGGGSEETKQLEVLASKHANVCCVAGKFNLTQELDIISNLKVMLSMDSSNGHMAAMFGVKVVTLWGVTHPFAGFAPFNQINGNNLLSDQTQYPKIPTSIYGNRFPEGYELAIQTIPVERIVKKVKENL
ncbi:glycosyltransferase family 9 protein [bacterium]|nr:glycosyltransferase family 9 protein [bacterium]